MQIDPSKHRAAPDKKKEIEEIIRTFLLHECAEVITAYLFGSFVTGEAFSDIDLALLTGKSPEYPFSYELSLETKIEKMIKFPVDVRIIDKAPVPFSQNVIRTGKVILDRDPNFRAAFESIVLRQYFDFSFYRKRYLEEVLNAPV